MHSYFIPVVYKHSIQFLSNQPTMNGLINLPDFTRDGSDLSKEVKFSLVERLGWARKIAENAFHNTLELVCYFTCRVPNIQRI